MARDSRTGYRPGHASPGRQGGAPLNDIARLLPTPAVNDMGEGKTPDAWDQWTAKMQAAHGNGNGHGKSLAIEAQRLLPTPNHTDGDYPGIITTKPHQQRHLSAEVHNNWGMYADAINRWESLTRPAPAPTQPSKKGTPQLSPLFSEWLMGLPAGHVTDVPGLTRNDMLKALGNGVVWQQAAAATRYLLNVMEATDAA
jgi:DNA (cytosine-5)-methyltransferase 1